MGIEAGVAPPRSLSSGHRRPSHRRPIFLEALPGVGQDHVVEDVDAHEGAGVAEARGQGDVVAARGGSLRVVVEEDDRSLMVGRDRAEDDAGFASRIALDGIVVRR